jgi:hypothetical protein
VIGVYDITQNVITKLRPSVISIIRASGGTELIALSHAVTGTV